MKKTYTLSLVFLFCFYGNTLRSQTNWNITSAGLDSLNPIGLTLDSIGNALVYGNANGNSPGVFITLDSAANWIQIPTPSTPAGYEKFFDLVALDSLWVSSMQDASGGIGSFGSTNGGASWFPLDSLFPIGFSAQSFGRGNGQSFALGVDSLGPAMLSSANGGASWTPLSPSGLGVDSLYISIGGKGGNLYLLALDSLSDFVFYRSTDNGNSWSTASTTWPLLNHVSDFTLDSAGVLYACGNMSPLPNSATLWRSVDHGANWSPLSITGIVLDSIYASVQFARGSLYMIASEGGTSDVFISADAVSITAGIHTSPLGFYPNPATQSIQLQLPGEKTFQVDIMDLSGRIFISRKCEAHSTITLDGLSPGMYSITARNGSEFYSGKMIVR